MKKELLKLAKSKDLREWIAILISLITLIVLIWGANSIYNIRVNLDSIEARSIISQTSFTLLPNGSVGACEYYDENRSLYITAGTCPEEIIRKYKH